MTIDFEAIRFNNHINIVQSEIDYLSGNELPEMEDKDNKIGELNEIMDNLKKNINDNKKDFRDKMFEEIDKYTFKKPWNRLPTFHKKDRITKYINSTYGEGKFQREVMLALLKYIDEGQLNTKAAIEYDHKNEQILSIPALKIDIDEKTYAIKKIKNKVI